MRSTVENITASDTFKIYDFDFDCRCNCLEKSDDVGVRFTRQQQNNQPKTN